MSHSVIRVPFLPGDEGVPRVFKTEREKTVRAFYDLLYPTAGIQYDVVFIRAPPCSGKTGIAHNLCRLLFENQHRSVVCLHCCRLKEDGESVASLFERKTNFSLEEFIRRKEERVLILDDAQCAYQDNDFWRKIVKSTLGNKLPNLKLVLLASYGSYNPYKALISGGPLVTIDEENVFLLHDEPDRPSLSLQFEEFEEMISGTVLEKSKEEIWLVCANHIGVAFSVLEHLTHIFHNFGSVSRAQILLALYDNRLLAAAAMHRGMPTLEAISTLSMTHKAAGVDIHHMRKILDQVACGALLKLNSRTFTPEIEKAADLLVRYGFLYEDAEKRLCFASQMHLKVWLMSIREQTAIC
ncbi:hypothetical protein HDV01_004139 [Terramyces sp. JEL0728]|nr:hypothetical protein HDV01_004139 [Terramyces sp. JEL0728]